MTILLLLEEINRDGTSLLLFPLLTSFIFPQKSNTHVHSAHVCVRWAVGAEEWDRFISYANEICVYRNIVFASIYNIIHCHTTVVADIVIDRRYTALWPLSTSDSPFLSLTHTRTPSFSLILPLRWIYANARVTWNRNMIRIKTNISRRKQAHTITTKRPSARANNKNQMRRRRKKWKRSRRCVFLIHSSALFFVSSWIVDIIIIIRFFHSLPYFIY